jgi:ATP-binding cassette subfamily F protein 3
MDLDAELLPLKSLCEPELFEYIYSYFKDDSNDFTFEGLKDFISPLITLGSNENVTLDSLCEKLSNLLETKQDSVVQLHKSIQISSITSENNISKKVDLTHLQSNRVVKTKVDIRKLMLAEKKIDEKRKARGDYQGETIPEWNPLKAPSMVVNQAKVGSDTKSKDVCFNDFDIQFAGKKILVDASLMLAHGRRYGLVGKNGIGKSTLLRAISNNELSVPAHIKVLHVEQEVCFY